MGFHGNYDVNIPRSFTSPEPLTTGTLVDDPTAHQIDIPVLPRPEFRSGMQGLYELINEWHSLAVPPASYVEHIPGTSQLPPDLTPPTREEEQAMLRMIWEALHEHSQVWADNYVN